VWPVGHAPKAVDPGRIDWRSRKHAGCPAVILSELSAGKRLKAREDQLKLPEINLSHRHAAYGSALGTRCEVLGFLAGIEHPKLVFSIIQSKSNAPHAMHLREKMPPGRITRPRGLPRRATVLG